MILPKEYSGRQRLGIDISFTSWSYEIRQETMCLLRLAICGNVYVIYFVPNSNCIIYARHHEDNLSKDAVIKAIYVQLDIRCEAYKEFTDNTVGEPNPFKKSYELLDTIKCSILRIFTINDILMSKYF